MRKFCRKTVVEVGMDKKEPGIIVYLTGLFEKNKGVLPVYWEIGRAHV